MKQPRYLALAITFASLGIYSGLPAAARASQAQPIDAARSKMTLYVFKSGLFSAFAHDHEIHAPIESGGIKSTRSLGAELRIDTRKPWVEDPEASSSTRAEVRETMPGPQVLDAGRFPEIHFVSTSIEVRQANHWSVRGILSLHGQSPPVTVDVTFTDGKYRGTATLKQGAFGIAPVRISAGTVRAKEEVRIDFAIAAAK